jgi:hypothetical protein
VLRDGGLEERGGGQGGHGRRIEDEVGAEKGEECYIFRVSALLCVFR